MNFTWLFNKSGGPWGGGGDDDNTPPSNPWGRRPGSSQKDFDETFERMQQRFKKVMGGNNGGNFKPSTIYIGIAFLLGLWLLTGLFRVQEGEVGVVLRFGEMVRIASPGLRYHLPSPMEQVIVQKVAAVNTIDGGMRSNDKTGEASDLSLILTGDENMVHTNYTVLWKIKDVSEFLFTARQPEATIKVAAESVIREIIGQTSARSALTEGRDLIGSQAQALLQKLLDSYKMGIQIVSVQLQNVAPPHEVVSAFNDVQASLVNADQARNEAEAKRNDIIPRAQGQAIQIKQEAEAYRESQVAAAQGEASRFEQILKAYHKNRQVAIKRYYFESMQQILGQVDKIIMDSKSSQGILPYLPLTELKKKVQAKESNG